jgi:HAE1 family hydrophobic/amphiphilic exporter-1
MNLINSFVHSPVKVSVGVLLLMLFGFIALVRMPMQLTPEVQTPTLTIETAWPGASPQEVEREIIQEQEEQLKGVEGVTKMTSESMDSMGKITLEFLVGTNMSEGLLKVNTRLQQVREYPVDADEPVIKTANLSDRPIAWFILSPRIPTAPEIETFLARYPQHQAALQPVLNAANEGVAMLRLGQAAARHEEIKQLLPPEVDVTKLKKFAEDFIEAKFERVQGVSDSQVLGGREDEMQVILDPEKLAARRLTIADVRNALRAQNKDTSGGDFWEGRRRYVVRTLGQFRNPEQVGGTLLSNVDNAPVYLRDVAAIEPGHRKPDGLVRRFGTERIAVNASRATGANVLEVMKGLQEATRELNEGLLKQRGLELVQVYDETQYIYSAVDLVQDNIVVGGLLTVAVLLLFLKSGRSTLVISLAIPTSIIGTFLMMHLMGRSLNVISLAGLAFAVGMLVDNAVVVLENIYRYHQLGHPPFEAAVKGTQEVWGAVLASTLTTLAVFIPVFFVEEEAGQLFRDIALAISSGIALSLIVSITVIPTAAARLLKEHPSAEGLRGTLPENRIAGLAPRADELANGRLTLWGRVWHSPPLRVSRSLIQRLLHAIVLPFDMVGRAFLAVILGINKFLQHSVLLRLGTVLGFVGVSIWLSYVMMPKVEYLPTGNRNLVFGILLPPPGYNLNQMIAIGNQLETDLKPYWDVDKDDPKLAELDHPAIADYFFVARGRNLFMGVRSLDPMRVPELIPLIRKVGANIPGTFVLASQSSLFEQGLGAGRTVDVEITGPELEKLIQIGFQVLGKVQEVVPGAQAFPKPSLDLSSPEVHIVPRKEQAAEMGFSALDLGYTVDALVDGAYATDYFVGGAKIDLRILGSEGTKNFTQDLDALPVATPKGELVSLRALAEVVPASGPEQINHRERQRAITIAVAPPPEIALEDAMERIERDIVQPLIDAGALESGTYQINLAGTADKLRATWTALRFNFILALLITYLLMAALFESWLYPFVVIMSVPLGAVGGFAGLWLLNLWVLQSLDVLTMLGFVILIGTVVNNPILIVEQTLVHMREEGMSMNAALLESVRNRIRPIFMTTTTTLFGLIPLVLFPGAGSELYRGLGAVLLGGLLVSTVVTLVVVPALFSLTMQAKERELWAIGWRPAERPAVSPEAVSVT